ncbi:MAG: HEAT repeat domain-containing protein [Candidatus Hydrogenedentales bacterium]
MKSLVLFRCAHYPSLCLALTFMVALGLSPYSQALDSSLEEQFTAFCTYEQGGSEVPLRTVEQAVYAANTGKPGAPSPDELEEAFITVLSGDCTVDAKRFACRMLGEISKPQGAQILAQQLAVETLFSTALAALEHMDIHESTQSLIAALNTSDLEKKRAILLALGRQGSEECVPILISFLKGSEAMLNEAAVHALSSINSEAACKKLVDALEETQEEKQPYLWDGCLSCANHWMDSDLNEAILEVLNKMAAPDFPDHIRLAAVALLIQAQPEQSQALLTALLQDPSFPLASDALMLARNIENTEITQSLIDLLPTIAAPLRAGLLDALAVRGDRSARAAVQAFTNDENTEVRLAALKATGMLADSTLTDFLLDRAVNASVEEQRIAKEALMVMADTTLNTQLMEVAKGKDDEPLRLQAIALLAERQAAESVELLFLLAADGEPTIRVEAINALRVLATGDELSQLLQLVSYPKVDDIATVLPSTIKDLALRRFENNDKAAQPVIESLQQIQPSEEDDDSALSAFNLLLESLSLIGGDSAFNEIQTHLADENLQVRKNALLSLSRFQRTETLEMLQQRVKEEQDNATRALAYSKYLGAMSTAKILPGKDVDEHLRYAAGQAQTTAARREFLAASSQLPSLECLRLIESELDNPEVAAEALRAALTVSRALTGAWPKEAAARLRAIADDETQGQEIRHEAKDALNTMRSHKDYLMAWEMAGPYFEDNTIAYFLFEQKFPPEKDADSANWRCFPLLPKTEPPFKLDFNRVLGGDNRVVFIRSFINSPTDQDAVLELGTNDGCKLWWNGKLIHGINVGRPLTPGEDKLELQLNAGLNTLMVAVFQQEGDWGATLRFVDREGNTLENITASTQP